VNATQVARNRVLCLVAGAMAIGLIAPALLLAGEGGADVAALVESMPNADKDSDGKYTGPTPEAALEAIQQVLKGGKANIIALIDMLKEPGQGQDYKAHYLLHATATHVATPGTVEERQVVCDALVAALGGSRPPIIRAHILEELKWIGGTESIQAVSKFLLDDQLYDFAVQALVARKAAAPIRAALPKAKGRNRVALIQALGTIRDDEAVPALIPEVKSADADVRLAAVEALGNIGDPRAVDPLLEVARLEKATYEEMKTAEAVLRLGQRLIDAGKKDDAKRVYATLSKRCTGKAGRHIRVGCLQGLAALAGEEVITELLAAMADPDPQVRAIAAQIAASLPGGEAVDKWLGLLKKAPANDRAGILFILGAVGDPKALPAVLAAMDDKDKATRLEAMRSAAAIGGQEAAEALVARVFTKDDEQQQTALESLTKNRGNETNKVVADAAGKASDPTVKARLVDVLAARRASDQMPVIVAAAEDPNAQVRIAAAWALEAVGGGGEAAVVVKMLTKAKEDKERKAAEQALLAIGPRARDQAAEAVMAALEGADADASAAMFRLLARVGGGKAAKVLATHANSPDPKVRDEAIRALSTWSESSGLVEAADALLKIANTAEDIKHHAMALRSYINLARSEHWRRNTAQQLKIYREALRIAKRAEERRAVLGALGDIHETESVKLAASCLQDKDVAEEAAAAVVRIVGRLKNKTAQEAQEALEQVMKVAKNEGTLKEARKFLIKKPPQDPL